MSSFASLMVMRAEVRRNASGKDAYGHKKPAGWQVVQGAMPCYVFISQETEVVDRQSVVVEVIKGYFRRNADIARGDQVVEVKDRRDRVVVAGPLIVDEIAEKTEGAVASHKEVRLRRHRG